ncbi:MAG: Hpt domain-containing protein, partial [Armatimonadota bacterium]|nr:Hpt domain-containing protein [Armatimonadota bacterium]
MGNAPFSEFLDDYFAECEEHLAAVRRGVLDLEASAGQAHTDSGLINDLFRRFHSLKGLSGMVGFEDAEGLAHELENYLRSLREGKARVTPAGVDALIVGTRAMEQVIAAHREGQGTPNLEPVLAQLRGVTAAPIDGPPPSSPQAAEGPSGGGVPLKPDQERELAAAAAQGRKVWKVEFTPSQELNARGLNVNTLRAELQQQGQLVAALPFIGAGGGVVFRFFLVTDPAAPPP